MLALISVSFAVLAVFALGAVVALRRPKSRARLDPAAPPPSHTPRVSVIVPARNEEAVLAACLASLTAQDYPDLEVVCVDDRSTDATARILADAARDRRVVAVAGEEPPPGWLGKPNAVRQAVERASGEWLLFTDADTVHTPGSVRAALTYAAREGIASLSALPKMDCTSSWAKLLVPQLGALLFAGRSAKRVNDPSTDTVFGNGPYFFVRRDAYDAAGGIDAVRGAPDEDLAFARALKRTGLGYHFVEGEAVCTVRMYSRLGEFYAGFGRNLWPALGQRWSKLVKLTLVLWTMSLVPITAMITSAVALARGDTGALLVLGVAQYFALLAIQALIRAKSGFPPYLALFAPLGGLLAWSILVYSAWRSTRGGVAWKGRTYPAPGAPG
ncbi:glycosyltransferase [Myxococcota bacterium]|nr:glycosyltransferase [Myxococcota bacterium]